MQSHAPNAPLQDNSDGEVFDCNCLTCQKKGITTVSYSSWYRHQPSREEEVLSGVIPPLHPSAHIPNGKRAKKHAKKRPRGSQVSEFERSIRQRSEHGDGGNGDLDGNSGDLDGNSGDLDGNGSDLDSAIGDLDGGNGGNGDLDGLDGNGGDDRGRCSGGDHEGVAAPGVIEHIPGGTGQPGMPITEPGQGQGTEAPTGTLAPSANVAHAGDRGEMPNAGETTGAAQQGAQPREDGGRPDPLPTSSQIPAIDTALKFIRELRDNPRIADENLDDATKQRMRDPITEPIGLTPDERLSLKLFLADTDGSEKIYTLCRSAILERHPDDDILTHHRVKQLVAELSGITPVLHDMCPNSCMAYTGPFRDLDACLHCSEQRYDLAMLAKGKKKPLQQFNTFPIGPQIQARYRSPEGASDMQYRERQMPDIFEELRRSGKLDSLDDLYHGQDFWNAHQHGHIGANDVALIFSMDGAQLYEHKPSNSWIYIWILVDLPPDKRYKKRWLMPGAIVPGPNKPKNPDSYLFPGLHHVAALQNEGLSIWDASSNTILNSCPFLFLATSDAVGAPELTGYVGHHGKKGCRNRCGRDGRRKPGAPHYYAVCLKPDNYNESGCTHEDYEPSNIPNPSSEQYDNDLILLAGSQRVSEYEANRLLTGISKPSIFLGIWSIFRLAFPQLFPGDIMHLFGLNIPDLLIKLWRGTMTCDTKNGDSKDSWDWVCLVGETWKKHGADVAAARHHLPGSFDRPPRNPAEKINSGYKCWEFLHWLYGMGPALLHGILPDKYWKNFCKLAAGVRIIFQKRSTEIQLRKAHELLSDFVYEFELLYVQRKISRMHFLPQCVHAITHASPETFRIGPLPDTSQFTIERTIGDLGAEIRQPSRPFANLAQRALRRAQVNGIKAMFPDLEEKSPQNMPAEDLGNGFTLLHMKEERPHIVRVCEEEAISVYLGKLGNESDHRNWLKDPYVRRWARCRLPNGQICRSAWREVENNVTRTARNVKLAIGTSKETSYGEIQYFFQHLISGKMHSLALVSLYGPPDQELLQESMGTVWACHHAEADERLIIVDVKDIIACVAMIPTGYASRMHNADGSTCFAMDKLGVCIGNLGGMDEGDANDNEDNVDTDV